MDAIEKRFWKNVKVGMPLECWEWQTSLDKGRGQVFFNGKTRRSASVAYSLVCGEIPDGQHARQTCGNLKCCNPLHLFLSDSLVTMKKPKETYEAKFWRNVDTSGECWLWMGARTGRGYGNFWDGSKQRPAHRYAYELINGPIAEGLFACHKCDNPQCVNPDHIFPGTPKDNMQDMQAKGRKKSNGYDKRTHCIRGHELAGDNLRKTGNGTRQCKKCSTDWSRAKRAKVKQLSATI